jgi:hypothetical protein
MSKSVLRKIVVSLIFAVLLVVPTSSIPLSQVNAQETTHKSQGFSAAERQRLIESSKITKSYDKAGRAETVTVAVEGRGPSFKFKFEYDEKNRVKAIVEESGARTLYSYGANGELKSASYPDGITYIRTDKGTWKAVKNARQERSSLREGRRGISTVNAAFQSLGSCLSETAKAVAATAAYVACSVYADPATCQPLAEAAEIQWGRAALACATPRDAMLEEAD